MGGTVYDILLFNNVNLLQLGGTVYDRLLFINIFK